MGTMSSRQSAVLLLAGIMAVLSCVGSPPPRPLYQDRLTVIELRTDPQAGRGHSHPATMSLEQMARILAGIKVRKDRSVVHLLFTDEAETSRAFNSEEVAALTPLLVQALGSAQPGELVTFYRRFSNAASGLVYTTGGMFMRDGHLYIILANYRQSSAATMSIGNPAYEIDPVDDPLLSLRRGSYAVSFVPQEAEVHPVAGQWQWNYPDRGKIVVVDPALVVRSPASAPDSSRAPAARP